MLFRSPSDGGAPVVQGPSTSSLSAGSSVSSTTSGDSVEAVVGVDTSAAQVDPQNFRKADEVAQVRKGALVFGILEHPIKDFMEKDKAEKFAEWKVRWNTSDCIGVTFHCPLTTTERSVSN